MLCRVVPPIVARHPEILNFPKPVKTTTRPAIYYKKIERKISSLVGDKLCEKF
ncbi:hypothetical protein KIT04_109 [Vibrio phage KIT04]|nr:hypothetical protein KIT04_109 [Vibrio phage KIT04]